MNELVQELDESKLAFALTKVIDDNSGLQKIVAISWVIPILKPNPLMNDLVRSVQTEFHLRRKSFSMLIYLMSSHSSRVITWKSRLETRMISSLILSGKRSRIARVQSIPYRQAIHRPRTRILLLYLNLDLWLP